MTLRASSSGGGAPSERRSSPTWRGDGRGWWRRWGCSAGRGAAGSDLVEFGFTATSEGQTVEKNDSASVVLGGGVPFGKEFESHLAGARAGEGEGVGGRVGQGAVPRGPR